MSSFLLGWADGRSTSHCASAAEKPSLKRKTLRPGLNIANPHLDGIVGLEAQFAASVTGRALVERSFLDQTGCAGLEAVIA